MSDISPKAISIEYYSFVEGFTQSDYEDDKILGKFYTDYKVARTMIKSLCGQMSGAPVNQRLSIIDPFCGDGRLVLLLLEEIAQISAYHSAHLIISLWDIDKEAVRTAADAVRKFCNEKYLDFEVDARVADAFVEYIPMVGHFDICVTNPPWSLLKPQKLFAKSNDEMAMSTYRDAIEKYDTYMKTAFPNSQPTKKFGKWGTNLARCGTEVALKLVRSGGISGIVSPASLLNDQVSTPLRRWIFDHFCVTDISYYPAELKLYGSVDISSVTIVIRSEEQAESIRVRIFNQKNSYSERHIVGELLKYIKNHDYSLPFKTGIDSIPIMMFLEQLPTTEEYCSDTGLKFIREMDETRFMDHVSDEGKITFAKGFMVDRYTFKPAGFYLKHGETCIHPSVYCHKIVWRDVSRDSQIRRMKATILPPNHICGNSLGVIYPTTGNLDALKTLVAVMNSFIFEFQARSMLVSNHVATGIVKQIRVPRFAPDSEIVKLVDRQIGGENVETEIEVAVANLYGIPMDAYRIIVETYNIPREIKDTLLQLYMKSTAEKEKKGPMIYNHYAAALSKLDMQIVHCVPPGGNWKDIPETVPSQRLAQIRESYKAGKGSRSTYYGRLLPEMPSYTINTYFNRPGNGCHIHYVQDRTLSQREAARFQTFPDSFEFIGSQGAINNQIGNAVPPLLAYQIAKTLPHRGQFIDLFCGAGGLALGFVWAGWTPIIANDIDAYAVDTYKRNIAGDAIVGDINSDEVVDAIVSAAKKARETHPDLPLYVLGGPPCQGFSTANTRRGRDDLRNWLFKAYIKIVNAIRPDGFIFENVRGITNLDKGQFFEMIQSELKQCIEEIKVNQVNSAFFGIPQRRERVIIIGGKRDLVSKFFLGAITSVQKNGQISLLPPVIGAEDAIGDLPSLKPAEDGSSFPYKCPCVF